MNKYLSIFIFIIIFTIIIIILLKFFKAKEKFYKNREKSYTKMLKSLLKDDYERIIKDIKKCKNSEEILMLLEKEKKIKLVNKNIKVKNLIPLQKSIDINKSLYFLLKDYKKVENILKGKSPFENKIFIYEDNILDGHHRWFQIYLLNPECKIEVLEIQGINKYLVNMFQNYVEIVKLDNDLLKVSDKYIKDYIIKNISENVLNTFKNYYRVNNNYNITENLLNGINKIKKNVFFNK
jgi:hypothetical protein